MEALRAPGPLRAVELRPPRVGLIGGRSVDAWIDLNQAMRALLRAGRFVLFTDDAVGDPEEESLQHLTSNLGAGHDLSRVVPFLTCKHSLEYCLLFARRAASHRLGALTVTGGDRSVGPARCVPHSRDLRRLIREQVPDLALGAWVNPFRDPGEQVDLLLDPDFYADYVLTQVVSHHEIEPLERFLATAAERGVTLPILVGVFYYRSGRPRTLERLGKFIPVPADALREEFERGATPEAVCARSLEALRERGIEKIYLSNLEPRKAEERLRRIEALL
ncbi:MAG: hypothetical protein WEG36_08520 [Gemmatimonadota bacterium]